MPYWKVYFALFLFFSAFLCYDESQSNRLIGVLTCKLYDMLWKGMVII